MLPELGVFGRFFGLRLATFKGIGAEAPLPREAREFLGFGAWLVEAGGSMCREFEGSG